MSPLVFVFNVAERYAKTGPLSESQDVSLGQISVPPAIAGGLMTSMRIY
jgi:hypothetical protein